jgi:hypothetical protein
VIGWALLSAALALVLLAVAMLWAVPTVVVGGLTWAVYEATPVRGSFQDSLGG